MKLDEFRNLLSSNPGKRVVFFLEGRELPPHLHVTEIGREERDFLDCGGTRRRRERCVLQLWVGEDVDHRLVSDKLLGIVDMGSVLFEHDIPVVWVEWEIGSVSQYPLTSFRTDGSNVLLALGENHTQCLAPGKCCRLPVVEV
jgi:hypothetical protein